MNKPSDIVLIKASGKKVPFNIDKFRNSLENTGASADTIDEVSNYILEEISGITTTRQLYKKAYSYLKKSSSVTASRYSLKKAILDFGPSGYPFEKFVAELLNYQGYKTQVGVIVDGHCVQHEIDVVAVKENKQIMVECKFHIDQSRKTDVKTPLYIHSRFRDIEKRRRKSVESTPKFSEGWIVTNTRFSEDASQYGNCAGLKLISWDYPKKGSLKQRISVSGLHPVTCLSTLTQREKEKLLEMGVVLCKQLHEHPEWAERLHLSTTRFNKVMKEAEKINQL